VVCPETSRGPALVPAGVIAGAAFCIDRTEVTEEQFDAFLRDVKEPHAVLELMPEVCAYKQRFGPVNFRSNLIYPMGNVDWCDAATFCSWAGKRLCRAVGEPDYSSAQPTAANSEWNYACSNAGTQRFPWGNDPQPLACNARCRDNCRSDLREKVATRTTCQGGIEGVYDLGGNQTEWVDWCDFRDPTYRTCRVQGGFWHDRSIAHESDDDAGDCQTNDSHPISQAWDELGFRCCADAALE
jgi:formylglycine-generating enzyme required for sulfatase activity